MTHATTDTKPFNTPVLLAADGKPARLPAEAKCPQCGAGPEHREQSGFGPMQDVTCSRCAFEFGKVAV
jgi:hypothetical protein